MRAGTITAAPGTIAEIGGVLVNEPGETAELGGGGAWLSAAGTLRGGTVRMTDGAVLEGSATLQQVTFEGELHNYPFFSFGSPRKDMYPFYINGYGPGVSISTNATLNGRIVFHTDTNWPGTLVFSSGFNSITPVPLNGNGRIEFQGPGDLNSIYYTSPAGLAGRIEIGPGITIHGQNLTIGATQLALGISGPYFINRGTLTTAPGDNLSFVGAFTNSGTVHISSTSIVNWTGDYAQTSEGQLEFELAGIAPGVGFGQLKITRDAVLDGTLRVIPVSPFQPARGAAFQLMTYDTQSGAFHNIQAPPITGVTWTAHYNPKDFTLRLE
jgi:hypothetical protein